MAFHAMLPKPTLSRSKWDEGSDDDSEDEDARMVAGLATSTIPAYGSRQKWTPRTQDDFGTGGAFPECHTAQFPLDMGKEEKAGSGQIVPLTLGADGKVQYDQLLRQGSSKDKIIHSTYNALVPVTITHDDDKRNLPDKEEVDATEEKTKKALGLIVEGKIHAAQTSRIQKQGLEPTFVRYTSANQGAAFNSGAKQRIIRMVDVQKDPLEPPKFLTNKKIPKGPGSPPAPVLHSPPRKVTAKQQEDWKVPPCVSSWKNQKGFTIPLDKRLAADGRGLQDVHINDGFAKFSESLFIAERASREAIETRRKIQSKASSREKEKREDELRNLAEKSREERTGIQPSKNEEEEVRERDQIRHERQHDRERERRIAAAAPDKRDKLKRNRERDVSEQIALGLPSADGGGAGGGLDSRLYNQSQGMTSGFNDDDSYDVYDRPMRGEKASSIYRPTKGTEQEYTDEDVEKMKNSGTRFHKADKGFNGAEGRQQRDGPVQFEKAEDANILGGLDDFLNEAKGGSKRKDQNSDAGDRNKKSRY